MTFFIDSPDPRCEFAAQALTSLGHKTLPLSLYQSASNDDTLLFAPNKKFDSNFLNSLPENISIICGNLPPKQKDILKSKSITHLNVLNDEVFAIKNSCLTAEGILANILIHSPHSLNKNKILVLGSGRVGKATASLFSKLGLNFSLSSNDENNFATTHIFSENNFFKNDFLNYLQDFDIIINTVPAKLIPDDHIPKIQKNALFLEISSIAVFENPENLHFKYILCPALPQKFSSLTACQYFFDAITKMIK